MPLCAESRLLCKLQLPASANKGKVQIANLGFQRPPEGCFALSLLRAMCSAESESRKNEVHSFSAVV